MYIHKMSVSFFVIESLIDFFFFFCGNKALLHCKLQLTCLYLGVQDPIFGDNFELQKQGTISLQNSQLTGLIPGPVFW